MELTINPLRSGTIIKIYASNRGQDYVIIGKSIEKKKLFLVKNSAITNNGLLFTQSKLYSLDIVPMFQKTDPFYFVPKIKRVVGHRILGDIKKDVLINLVNGTQSFYNDINPVINSLNSFESLKTMDEVYPPLDTPDINKVVRY